MLAGILSTVADMTVFLNPSKQSFHRLGFNKAPKYISWSSDNRSMLIRIPAASGEYRRVELRSPDCTTNPYLAFALLIWAGLEGIREQLSPPEASNVNLFTAAKHEVSHLQTLPLSRTTASRNTAASEFLARHLPAPLLNYFCKE